MGMDKAGEIVLAEVKKHRAIADFALHGGNVTLASEHLEVCLALMTVFVEAVHGTNEP